MLIKGDARVHNLSVENHSIHDPDLTPFGEEQCRRLAQDFPYHESVELLVCSPLRRTIYTTLLGFKPDVDRGVKVIAIPEVSETADVPCDTGSDLSVLVKEMKDQPIDLSRVMDGWNTKTGRWAPTAEAIEIRAREARQWLKSRPEKEIVLVTHGGFLHYLTEDWTGFNKVAGTGWNNVEFRTYQFQNEENKNATLMETAQSLEMRRGTEKPLTNAELIQLKETQGTTFEEAPAIHAKVYE